MKLKEKRHIHLLLHMFQLSQMPNFKLWKTHKTTGVRTRSSKKKIIIFKRPNNEKIEKKYNRSRAKIMELVT